MPGLTYNSSGVKDLLNAVQGYPVRDGRAKNELTEQLFFFFFCKRCLTCKNPACFSTSKPFYKMSGFYSGSSDCIVRYPLCFPTGYQTRLSCRLASFSHTYVAACCNLHGKDSFLSRAWGWSSFINSSSERAFLRYGQTSAFAIVCLSETPPPQTHYSPLPCTTVCPRGCYLTCTWARACSGPDWDVNYSQRLGVHFRCLRQVRIGGSGPGGGRGSKRSSAVAW